MTHEHKHEIAVGGFWVTADGSSIPVLTECAHYEALKNRGETYGLVRLKEGDWFADWYNCAYEAGWVRITYCDGGRTGVSFCGHKATVEALRETVRIMRHAALHSLRNNAAVEGDRSGVGVEAEPYATIRKKDPHHAVYRAAFPWWTGGADKVARQMMQFIMVKAKALRETAESVFQQPSPQLADALQSHGLPALT